MVTVAYDKWSLMRGSKYKALTVKMLVFFIGAWFLREFCRFRTWRFNCTINCTEYKITTSIVTSTCASENFQVTVEIFLVGFIIQSNGSELSDNVYCNDCTSFIFDLKLYMI